MFVVSETFLLCAWANSQLFYEVTRACTYCSAKHKNPVCLPYHAYSSLGRFGTSGSNAGLSMS